MLFRSITFFPRASEGSAASAPLGDWRIGDLAPDKYTFYTLRGRRDDIDLVPRYYVALLLAELFGAEDAPTPLPEPGESR